MTRKQFVESLGATCRNWRWSWSFVNHEKKVVLFGAWDDHRGPEGARILSEDWSTTRSGARSPAYTQSIEHLRLVEEEGYKLKIFTMSMSNKEECAAELEPGRIGGFEPDVSECTVKKVGRDWFAI